MGGMKTLPLMSPSVPDSVTLSPACLSLSPPPSIYHFLQEEKGISCGLVDLDFLKCSVGFPFMRAQTKVGHTGKQQCTKVTTACGVAQLRML